MKKLLGSWWKKEIFKTVLVRYELGQGREVF